MCLVHLCRETYHTHRHTHCVLTAPGPPSRVLKTLQTILHSSVRHAACHVTSRQDSTQTFPYHSSFRSACLALFFCRLPFPPPAPHPPVVPESAGSNHYRFLPTKKVCCRHSFFFFFLLSREFCLLFPSCPPTEPSPAARPAAALSPNPCRNRAMQPSRAPRSCELGGWCVCAR